MKYDNVVKGKFISRPNRFIANVEIDGKIEIAHVKNTGRCRELFVPDATVYLQRSDNPLRKTKYDVIAVEKGVRTINVDSQIPNKVFEEFVFTSDIWGNIDYIKPECFYKKSRFDFYIESGERKIFIEVKGVTLEENNIVRFPDAPTERGVKHLNELAETVKDGYEAYVVFVVQMSDVERFEPNRATHPGFAVALENAVKNGVKIYAFECNVSCDHITIEKEVSVCI